MATAVAIAVALLERVAAGERVTERQWVDATTALIESLPASITADAADGEADR